MATHQVPAKSKTKPKVKGKEANLVVEEAPEVTDDQRKAERRANVDSMAFAVQQLSATPAVPSTPKAPEQATVDFNNELKALQEKYGVKVAPAVLKAPKADKLQSNGITRPGANTTTGKVWAAADAITAAQNGVVAAIASVKAHQLTHGINSHTVKTQYARWRAYNGVKGRLPTLNPTPQVQGEDDGLAASVH